MSTTMRYAVRKSKIAFIALLVLAALCGLLSSDYFGIQMHGIAYFMDNTDRKYQHELIQDSNSYSIQINLDDFQSNKGKVLYDQNGVRIYIEKVYRQEIPEEIGDQYYVQFRSVPKCSDTGAVFVSFFPSEYRANGVTHIGIDQNNLTVKFLNGKTYHALNGSVDEGEQLVGWRLLDTSAIQDGMAKNVHGTVEFTVANLYLNVWSRK